MARGEKYESKTPCGKCGSTLRYRSDYKCVPCTSAKNKAHHWADPGRSREISRQWAKDNPEKNRKRSSRWYKENPMAAMASRANTKAKSRYNITERITKEDCEWVIARHGSSCLSCGSRDGVTIDHVVPLGRGGRNHRANLQPLCAVCNQSKGARHETDYRRSDHVAV